MMRKILEYILKRMWFLFPDKLYLKIIYYLKMGRRLDLDDPKTMNEKLQWLKLHNRKPEFTSMVDKISVKEYVAEKIGPQYVAPLLGVWDKVEDIDFESLPQQFVLKANHSGDNKGVVICPDKSALDVKKAEKNLKKSLKLDIYRVYREWPYKNVRKRFFAEEYLGKDLVDYKFYCFDGHADSVLVCIDRQIGDPKFYFFDKEWNLKRYNQRGKSAPADFTLPKPDGIDEMFGLASKLSEGLPFARIDFYNVNGRIYFGEITFYPSGGFDPKRLPEADLHFGSMIDLSKVKA